MDDTASYYAKQRMPLNNDELLTKVMDALKRNFDIVSNPGQGLHGEPQTDWLASSFEPYSLPLTSNATQCGNLVCLKNHYIEHNDNTPTCQLVHPTTLNVTEEIKALELPTLYNTSTTFQSCFQNFWLSMLNHQSNTDTDGDNTPLMIINSEACSPRKCFSDIFPSSAC